MPRNLTLLSKFINALAVGFFIEGVYLVDHTTPGWPQLESAPFVTFMDATMMKRLRVSARELVGNLDGSASKGALHSINWWWCPILLRLGKFCFGNSLRLTIQLTVDSLTYNTLHQTMPYNRPRGVFTLTQCECSYPRLL